QANGWHSVGTDHVTIDCAARAWFPSARRLQFRQATNPCGAHFRLFLRRRVPKLFGKGRMLTPFVRLAVVVLGVLPAPARQDAVTFDWTAYGHALRTHMPKCVADASALKQIHYLAEQTADKLAFLGIPPNYDEAGRDRALRKFNDSWLGTCGHTAQCLRQVCGGAGLSPQVCKTLVVLKRGRDGQVPCEINADHAAVVYLHPDGPVVFDLWCDGRTQNNFAGF